MQILQAASQEDESSEHAKTCCHRYLHQLLSVTFSDNSRGPDGVSPPGGWRIGAGAGAGLVDSDDDSNGDQPNDQSGVTDKCKEELFEFMSMIVCEEISIDLRRVVDQSEPLIELHGEDPVSNSGSVTVSRLATSKRLG